MDDAVLLKQGAEARVYVLPFQTPDAPNGRAVAKERFAKTYRHPRLDRQLTTRRTAGEGRIMSRLYRAGVPTPLLYLVDPTRSIIYMEHVAGASLRDWWTAARAAPLPGAGPSGLLPEQETLLAKRLGALLAAVHAQKVVHGDLTTSNVLVRGASAGDGSLADFDLVLIDFGLSHTSTLVEDMAVDLYVLERALVATHPHSEALFEQLLASYAAGVGSGASVIQRFHAVRQRGRKRVLLG